MPKKEPPPKVVLPYVTGSFHGKDAWRLALKRLASVLEVSLFYFLGSMLTNFNSLPGRLIPALLLVGAAAAYQMLRGKAQGASDVAYGETLYRRQAEGKDCGAEDRERSYHKLKGFFAALMGALPLVIVTAVFAALTGPIRYQLGALPAWTEELLGQSEWGDALRYYEQTVSVTALDVLRVVVRAMSMPMISVAAWLGNDAVLLAERLTPLLVLLAPLAYGVGYLQGPDERARVNGSIRQGVANKKRKENKERKRRQASKTPERLI